jgi:enediyne biosynthesis protein E4
MTTSAGYASSSAGPLHFGLGSETTAETVEIRWPSGTVQLLRNVAADRILVVTEPAP